MASIDHVRELAAENYPASKAVVRAYDAATATSGKAPKPTPIRVTVYSRYPDTGHDSNVETVVEPHKLAAFVAALADDETVIGFHVGSTK